MSRAPSAGHHGSGRPFDDESAIARVRSDGEADYDVIGVGLGPSNLSLAALADGLPGLRCAFFEQAAAFHWHPGLLLEGTTLQVPFLADLVTLIDPTSRWSFLSYLREHDRLFRFYLYERFHIPRREYDAYCRWVADGLDSTLFGTRVDAVRWLPDAGLFRVTISSAAGAATATGAATDESGDRSDQTTTRVVTTRHLVLGVGTEPTVPAAFARMPNGRVFHSADYRGRRALLDGARHVTVVGSGQSGAEVFADLLRAQPGTGHRLSWITRTPAFAPMEYSKLGLEQFTPDFVRYFHGLRQDRKDQLVPAQWQLYKGIDAETIAEIYDLLYERTIGGAEVAAALFPNVVVEAATSAGDAVGITLRCRHRDQDRDFTVETDAVVLATGYTPRRPALLDPVAGLLDTDDEGRFRIDSRYRVATAPDLTGRIYVQNAELHTHGVGAPDLGLGAWRAAVILDDLTDGHAHRLPAPSAFTTFGIPEGARGDQADIDGSGFHQAGTDLPGVDQSGPDPRAGEDGPIGPARRWNHPADGDSGDGAGPTGGGRPVRPAAVGGSGR